MNNMLKTFSASRQDDFFTYLTFLLAQRSDVSDSNTLIITKDFDDLAEPYLLMHILPLSVVTSNYNFSFVESLSRRIAHMMEAWPELRLFNPTLQRCCEFIASVEEDERFGEKFWMDLMGKLYEADSSDEHQQAVNDWVHEGLQSRNAAYSLLAEVHAAHTSFAAIGIELSYQQADTPLERIIQDREQLLNHMRTHAEFQHCAGVFWHLEFGQRKGHFLQMLFLYPTEQPNTAPELARQIGEYWQKTVTEERGRYYANDAVQEEYFYPGCLHVVNGDNAILDEVECALTFMTEMDLCARLVLPDGAPTFGVTHLGASDDLLA
ncbi:hypothetical protein ACQ86O_14180 [Serratia sp. L9]|uniref:hypothetical protein n=1 Tax=Serratia sp. L9 TaxID=3423946 RepID=UPI003D674337